MTNKPHAQRYIGAVIQQNIEEIRRRLAQRMNGRCLLEGLTLSRPILLEHMLEAVEGLATETVPSCYNAGGMQTSCGRSCQYYKIAEEEAWQPVPRRVIPEE